MKLRWGVVALLCLSLAEIRAQIRQTCGDDDFTCNNNRCIVQSRRCDHVIDCADGEDEQDCECTTAEFRCESDGLCIERRKVCDGTPHCADKSDEEYCRPAFGQFRCGDGTVIPDYKRCNRQYDCPYGDYSDERNCPTCSLGSFDCGGGLCLKSSSRCDGNRDCPNGEDEEDCEKDCVDKCSNGMCLDASMICDDKPDCPDGSDELHCPSCDELTDFRCYDGECIDARLHCNNVPECSDGSDELNCNMTIPTQRCREGEFRCNDGVCVNENFLCDGNEDCNDGTDEDNCPCTDQQWQCTSGQCVDISYMCNGVHDCKDGSDEGSFCLSPTTELPRESYTQSPFYPVVDVSVSTTHNPRGNDYNGFSDLQLRTYPNQQTVRHTEAGGDVVFQCRDEGPRRSPVRWVREGGRPLPRGSTDRNGRLEMFTVKSGDGGVYICQATGFLGSPGSELRVQLTVENLPVTPVPPPTKCERNEATCGNGQCIPKTAVCNGVQDCSDNSDEDTCNQNGRCEPNQYKCDNRRCVLKSWLCDSENDCGDGSDERNCGSIMPGQACAPVEYQCRSGDQCVPRSFHCDGLNDCLDGSDEIGCIPVYVSQPPQPSKITLSPGETLTLTCKAVGVPVPVIVWRLNWGHVPEKCQSSSIDGFGTLTCPDMQAADRGAYSCESINNKGTDFAIPDAIVDVIGTPPDVCPTGYFNSQATTESECIRCFCFGESRECKSADLFTYQMASPLGSGGTRLVGATVNPGGVNIESNQITDEYYYQPMMNGATVTKVNMYNTNSRASPYLALPESYNGNQLTSYGGRIKYKLQPHSTSNQYSSLDMATPDIVVKGQYGTLMYSFRKDRGPISQIYVETRFVPENWYKPSSRGPVPATREDIMMALDNIEVILIRASLNGGGVEITDFAMESAKDINAGLGAANLVEECKCPPGYEGLSCQKCAAGYIRESSGPWLGHCRREEVPCPAGTFGAPARGIPCQPCPCPLTNRENQFARTCTMETDRSITCDCMPGYEGANCERCAPGYVGNPLMPGDNCQRQAPQNCNPIGTRNVRLPDQCECKNHVHGRYCDQCNNGTFFLSPDFGHGCAECFCSGVTNQCTSSNLRRTTIAADFSSPQAYSQMKLYNTTKPSGTSRYSTPLETSIDPYRGVKFTSPDQTPSIYYWGLPPSFTGDKVTSYGGNLQYTIRSDVQYDMARRTTSAPDVQLISENRLTFHFFAENANISSDGTITVTVPFLEGKWRRPDGTEVQRQYLLLALADVKLLLVKASYWEYTTQSYLVSASIETAEPGGGGPEAQHVEQCSCPPGYLGTSCEDCAPGYTRGGDGFYLQHCGPCQCNGHSSSCHPETGECLDCADGTLGHHCESCKPGYSKDNNGNCISPSRDFECDTCDSSGTESCNNDRCYCKRNVEGSQCDRCRKYTFGLSMSNPDGCTPCYCYGLDVECHEASHYRLLPMPATVLGSDYGGYTITDLDGKQVINDHFVPVTNESELQYVFPFPPDEDLYWSLPKTFTGNKVLSYGGYLALTQRFESSDDRDFSTPGYDIILDGGRDIIYWNNPEQIRKRVSLSYKVPLRENVWRDMEDGQVVNRNVFMSVLANLKRILVLATLSTNVHSVAIADVSMDVATDKYDSGVRAESIELCECPTGYSGTSCETCQSGYYRDQYDRCFVCPCNNHDCQLDASDQVVCNCRPPYTGRDCSTIGPTTTTLPPYWTSGPSEPTVYVKITGQAIRIQEIGGTVNFTCKASSRNSRPLSMNWRKAGGPLPIDRAFTDYRTGTLTITNLQRSDSGMYICQASDGVTTGEDRTTLQVPSNPLQSPGATVSPAYKDYYEGERIELQCRVTGNPTPTITWKRDGQTQPLSLSTTRYDTTFIIENARVEDSGEYSCVASNTVGTAVGTAAVKVRRYPNSNPSRESLSVSPSSPKVFEGQNTSVVCTGTANIPLGSIGWSRQDGGDLQSNIRVDSGLLYIDIARLENQGVYICQTSSTDVAPVSVLITVATRSPQPDEKPEVSVMERQVSVPTGGNAFIECEARGTPTPRVKWTKHNGTFGRGVSQRGNTLVITDAEQSDEAYYMCEGTNPIDGTRVGNVYVMVSIERREKPSVTIWPEGEQAAHLNTEFEFVCQVMGGVPEPIVTWSRAGSRPLSPHTDIVSGNRLKFSNISVNDEGKYICSASNVAGEVIATADLKVLQRPQITVKPYYVEVNRGDPINVECRATGYPEPTVSIRRDAPDYSVIVAPTTGIATLRIYRSSERDDGDYRCIATSEAGTQEERFKIEVTRGDIPSGTNVDNSVTEQYPEQTSENYPPRPTGQKEKVEAVDGQTARITCFNTGTYYDVRWRRADGRPLQRNAEQSGNELLIRRASSADAGDYECLVVDPETGTSLEAYVVGLSIVRLPLITLNPPTQTVRPGESPTVDCIVDGDGVLQIKWQATNKPFSPRVEVRDTRLIFHQIEVEDAGHYVCVVESTAGNASGIAEVLVTGTGESRPVSIEQPRRPFYVGENVQVLCRARSRDYRVQWERLDRRQHVDSTTYGDGATLEVPNVQEADAGVYRCVGVDPYRQMYTDNFTLEVLPQLPDTDVSQTLGGDNNVVYTARLHDSVTLNCPHNLEEPTSIEWRREYVPLPPEVKTNEPILRLNRVSEKDAGNYICRVSNNRVAVEVKAVLRVTRIVPRFDSYSWLALPPLKDTYRKFEVDVTFKPMSEDGIILYNSENDGREGDYMMLQLANGIPEFTIEFGGGPVTVKGDKPLQLNTWHTIRISRIDTSVTMDVDNAGPVTDNSRYGSGLLFELNRPMYIGGVPDYGKLPFSATGFIGCVSMLVVGREEKNIMEEAEDEENVGECENCAPNPCLNNGVCQEARNPVGYMCLCPSGFAGLDCGRTDEACRPGLCGPGRCQDTSQGYKCNCPITYFGDRCEKRQNIEYPAFSGSAYLAMETPRTSRVFQMSMKVKAASPVSDGIIMYCAESARGLGKFSSLAVKDGRLEFRYDLGDPVGPVILRSMRPITAEEWTDVYISRLADTVSMKVDIGDSTSAKLPSPNIELLWETPMFVGGYDDSIVLNRNTGVTGGFNGCIKDVTLFGKPVDIVNTSIQSANVRECNNGDRGDIPDETNLSQYETICSKCRNGGYCTRPESTSCTCPPGYTGMYCESRATFTPMRPPNAADPCAARPCRNGGICKSDVYNRNYSCDCPLYYAGANCQMRLDLRESVGFNGNGYVELPAQLLSHERYTGTPVLIAILVHTVSDGVLLYQREINAPVGSGDYLLIQIQNGYATLEWDMGSGVSTIVVNKMPVSDGQIHRIIAEFRGTEATLTVDSYIGRNNTVGFSNILNADSNIYLGGIPEELNLRRLPGLTGCIQQFELMDMNRGIVLGSTAVDGRNTQRCRDQQSYNRGNGGDPINERR